MAMSGGLAGSYAGRRGMRGRLPGFSRFSPVQGQCDPRRQQAPKQELAGHGQGAEKFQEVDGHRDRVGVSRYGKDESRGKNP